MDYVAAVFSHAGTSMTWEQAVDKLRALECQKPGMSLGLALEHGFLEFIGNARTLSATRDPK